MMPGLLSMDEMPGSPSAIQGLFRVMMERGAEGDGQPIQQPQPTPPFAGGGQPMPIERSPAGAYQGLLSPEEIDSARPGLLGRLASLGRGAPAPSDRFRSNLDNILKMRMIAGQMAEQKKLGDVRQQIATRYSEVADETPQQTIARLRSMFAAYVAAGDTEMAGKVGEVVKALGGEGTKAARTPQEIRTGNEVILRDPETGAEVARYPIMPSPKDPNAPDTAALNREQKMFDRTNRLADDYRSETKIIAGAADQFRTLMSNVAGARAGLPQAQIAMVFSFMKTLDPGSVVREGEYATAANAAGVPERIRNQYNKVLEGSFLSPEQVDGFAKQAKETAKGWTTRQTNAMRLYSQRARRWGINPDDVVLDYFEGIASEPVASPTAKPGNAIRDRLGGIKP